MVTDYLVAGLSLYCWAQLRSDAQQRQVVQMAGLWLLYRGELQLEDAS